MENPSSFIDHIEEHLGRIQGGARISEGLSAARFPDCPAPGSTTFMTLGLSHHVFHQAQGVNVRLEFLVACHENFVEAFSPASVLADVCDTYVPTHHAPPRGTVIGPRGRFFPESEMEALYCSLPIYFHEGLVEFGGFEEPFLPIWLVPITSAEARFVHESGWPAFESLLEEADTDVMDLSRPSLLASGA